MLNLIFPKKAEPVFIHIQEVFAVNIELLDSHCMKMDEYRSLCVESFMTKRETTDEIPEDFHHKNAKYLMFDIY